MSHTFTNKDIFESGTREGVIKGWRTRRGASGQTQGMRNGVAKDARIFKRSLTSGSAESPRSFSTPKRVWNNTIRMHIKDRISQAKRAKRNWKADVYDSLGMKKVKGNLGGTYYE
jgi:hypothetical protein